MNQRAMNGRKPSTPLDCFFRDWSLLLRHRTPPVRYRRQRDPIKIRKMERYWWTDKRKVVRRSNVKNKLHIINRVYEPRYDHLRNGSLLYRRKHSSPMNSKSRSLLLLHETLHIYICSKVTFSVGKERGCTIHENLMDSEELYTSMSTTAKDIRHLSVQ